jgi:hypothetical protein
MSEVIRFLESMGRNPAMTAGEFAAGVAALGVDDAQKQALMQRDVAWLNDLLGGRAERMMLSQWAPENEPLRRDDDQEGEQPSQDPTPDSDEVN